MAVSASQRQQFSDLPGWEVVERGLSDLAAGRETIEALLLTSASPRLAQLGLEVPAPSADVNWRLYQLIERDVGERRAHGRYNALRRRLLSFLRTADGSAAD